MDNILAFPKSMLTRRMGTIGIDAHWHMCDARAAATDLLISGHPPRRDR